MDINANNISNAGGPDIWYTDAYGRGGRTEPFSGSIRQRIASVDNNIGVDANGPTIGDDRNYVSGPIFLVARVEEVRAPRADDCR